MPKMKTNKSVSKRFRRTGTGKIVRSHANCRHNLTSKSPDQKRRLRCETAIVRGADAKRIARMAPYM